MSEDKQEESAVSSPSLRGAFQIPGEMLATAVHNFQCTGLPQTIFAVCFIGKFLLHLILSYHLYIS